MDNLRNYRTNQIGTVDADFDHPTKGTQPTTLSPERSAEIIADPDTTVAAYVAPTPTKAQQIDELERTVTRRNLRQAALGDEGARQRLQSVEDAIIALGVRT